MPIITVPGEVSSEEIATALTSRLGPRYRVQEGKGVSWGFGMAHDADDDNIVVSVGSGRLWRTQVSISRDADRTVIQIEPPRPVQLRLINTVGIARKVRQALLDTPDLNDR
jgi:hypothetical protein